MSPVTIKKWIDDPKLRRQALTMLSGALIVLSLVVRYLLQNTGLANGLLAAAAVLAGSDIVVRAWANLRNKAFSIELLVSIAFIGALVIGEYWEAAAVTFLFIFGAYLEARTLSKTREVLGQLLDLAPTTAIVVRDGVQSEVAATEVELGETVLIKPGSKVPVDGKVLEGFSAVNESAITGEPIPEEKTVGNLVFAGSVNQNGTLKIEATGVGSDTTLARIIARVEEAQDEKAPTQRFIEKFARWYTPFIIVLSVVAYIITRDIELSLTLLVIGCPGALVISTPVSIVAGIGRAAKKGILIKGGEYLENAGKISAVALDKTGTLTEGKPRLMSIIPLNNGAHTVDKDQSDPKKWSPAQLEVLHWAGIAETFSEHPLARPILEEASKMEVLPEPQDFNMVIGRGVTATYDGKRIAVGSPELMELQGVPVSAEAETQLKALKSQGMTAVLVSVDSDAIGILGIADALRHNAAEMVKDLRNSGVKRILMLTGDDRLTAEAIAAQAGITEIHADLLPEDKLRIIRDLKAEGNVVAMTGDGINDDIGIAMGTAGTGIAIDTADIALMADDLMKISQAISLSKLTLANIRQNVIIALLTVGFLLAGVLLGRVHMAGGMLVHQLSVLIVIINGMRLLRA
ncbi:MAG TPA: cation-translocating P-type ATPase [Bellilinea sp.]|nr:cation-translocating P-type ATPase [Bellilinea sp.]